MASLFASAPIEANACSPGFDGLQVELREPGALPRNGVLVIEATSGAGGATNASDEIAVVVALDGVEVAGELEVVDLWDPDAFEHQVLVVWRPGAELAPAEGYQVSITVEDIDEGERVIESTFDVVDQAAPVLEFVTASVQGELREGLAAASFGARICCSMNFGCGDESDCTTAEERASVGLTASFDIGEAMENYTVVRPFSGMAGAAEDAGEWGMADAAEVQSFRPTFNELSESYCAAYEALDLLTGAVVTSDPTCLEAPDGLTLDQTPVDVDAWSEDCLDDPYWEDSGEPWVSPEDEEDELDTDAEPDTDGGVDSDTDSGGDASQDAAGGGCSVDRGSGTKWALWSLLGFGLLSLRRRG